MVYADLHVHTAYSDGIHSIEETIKLAKEKGIKVIAITDHDTVFHFQRSAKGMPAKWFRNNSWG